MAYTPLFLALVAGWGACLAPMQLLVLYCGINNTQLIFLILLMTYKVISIPKKMQYKISYICRLYLYLDILDINNRKNINYKAGIIGTMPYKCIFFIYTTSEMKLELGEVHFVTNIDLQIKFGLIYDLCLVSSLHKLIKLKLKNNSQTLPRRCVVAHSRYPSLQHHPNQEGLLAIQQDVILKGKFLVYII